METSANALIEQLPVELQVSILSSISDIPTLYNFITSSPNYFGTYFDHMVPILFAVLCNEYGPDFLDMYNA